MKKGYIDKETGHDIDHCPCEECGRKWNEIVMKLIEKKEDKKKLRLVVRKEE
jgi:hypothetical protein